MNLRDHFQAIYDQHGQLTPELVVQTARPKSHPLHSQVFDRTPHEASEAWYRHRAHELIQRVTITYKPPSGGEDRRVRAFVCTRTEAGHVYEPAEKVAAQPFLREMVLRDMERDWRQLQVRYGDFQEFVDLIRGTLELDEAA